MSEVFTRQQLKHRDAAIRLLAWKLRKAQKENAELRDRLNKATAALSGKGE